MAGITSNLAKKSKDHPRVVSWWSQDNFRRDNIAGPHGRSDSVLPFVFKVMPFVLKLWEGHKMWKNHVQTIVIFFQSLAPFQKNLNKLRYREKATKFEKKSHPCFDVYSVLSK